MACIWNWMNNSTSADPFVDMQSHTREDPDLSRAIEQLLYRGIEGFWAPSRKICSCRSNIRSRFGIVSGKSAVRTKEAVISQKHAISSEDRISKRYRHTVWSMSGKIVRHASHSSQLDWLVV